MRFAPLFALLLAAPALHAQTCTPDPTPPESYYPLGVGDEWIYHAPAFSASAESYVRRRVLREAAVGGQTYVVDQICFIGVADGTQTCGAERLVRFDGGNVVERTPGGEGAVFENLDAPFGSNPLGTCASDLGTGPVVIGGTGYTVARVKALPALDFGPPPFAAGIGPLGLQVGNLAERTDRFEFARVGGVEYGVRPAVPGPDPTPAEAYAPLAVGTRSEFRLHSQGGPTTGYRRETVVRDTLIDGTTWHVRRDQTFSATMTRMSDTRRLVRFDPALANVVERTGSGVSQRYPCRLDLDLTGEGFGSCSVGVTYRKRVGTAPPGVSTTVLSFSYDFGSTSVAAGLGLVSTVDEGVFTDLVFSRTAAQTVGTPVDGLPFAPDPTPPADYYPLEVGNEWIYYYASFGPDGSGAFYIRRRVLREETVDGQRYAVDQQCTYDIRAANPTWVCEAEQFVRYDPATTNVLRRGGGGEFLEYCKLGADFDAAVVCEPSGLSTRYVDYGTGPVTIGGVSYTVASVKGQATLANVPPAALIAGIGPGAPPVGAFQESRFEFARVRGVEYGVRPVAGEAGAVPSGSLALSASPNPTDGPLALALTLPEAGAVTVEAFDALGRRVWQTTAALSAGAQTLAVDASAWAPGVYVVRATAAGGGGAGRASATARVVRR